MTPEEEQVLRNLVVVAKTLSNYDNKPFAIRKAADWERLKSRIQDADKLLASNSTKKETK